MIVNSNLSIPPSYIRTFQTLILSQFLLERDLAEHGYLGYIYQRVEVSATSNKTSFWVALLTPGFIIPERRFAGGITF
jgi:hypothetical protein